jgi:hypothetical protein
MKKTIELEIIVETYREKIKFDITEISTYNVIFKLL